MFYTLKSPSTRKIEYAEKQLMEVKMEARAAELDDAMRVSAKSNPNAVAGAIAGMVREKGRAETITIGAGALNQAVKALAIARGFLAPSGIDLICRPAFADGECDGREMTAIRLMIEPR